MENELLMAILIFMLSATALYLTISKRKLGNYRDYQLRSYYGQKEKKEE
jgi:hypothetical protein